jgi:hypothetical protein
MGKHESALLMKICFPDNGNIHRDADAAASSCMVSMCLV